MSTKEDTTTKSAAPAAAKPEPENILLETVGKRIRIRRAICSGRLSFGVTKSEADALVAAGLARIVGLI